MKFSKVLGILVLLLAHIGQVFASVSSPCQTLDIQTSSVVIASSSSMDCHDAELGEPLFPSTQALPDSNSQGISCCDQDCQCPIAMCSSAILSMDHYVHFADGRTHLLNFSIPSVQELLLSSPYRPPILG